MTRTTVVADDNPSPSNPSSKKRPKLLLPRQQQQQQQQQPPSSSTTESIDNSTKKKSSCSSSFNWRIYPPSTQPFVFDVGDSVILRSKRNDPIYSKRGRIVAINSNDQRYHNNRELQFQPYYNDKEERKRPEYDDVDKNDKQEVQQKQQHSIIRIQKNKDRKRLLPLIGFRDCKHNNDKKGTIIITFKTNHFRQLVYQIDPTDNVLEIGCSTGETSKLIIPIVQSWVGFDTSEEMIQICQERYISNPTSNINEKQQQQDDQKQKRMFCRCHAVKVDALIDPNKAYNEANKYGSPNVIFLDIGGNREFVNVIRMVSWVLTSFHSSLRLVIIKSEEMIHSIHQQKQSSSKSSSMSSDRITQTTPAAPTIIPIVNEVTGIIQNGNEWWDHQQRMYQKRILPKHPLQAPLVVSPKDSKTPICRYHNYHKHGCNRGNDCTFDHQYCHACQQLGHIARECTTTFF